MSVREMPNQRMYEESYEEDDNPNRDTRMKPKGAQKYQRQMMEQAYMHNAMRAETMQRQQLQMQTLAKAKAKKRRRKMLMRAAPYLIGAGTTGGAVGFIFNLMF